jgi:hypothetical protein
MSISRATAQEAVEYIRRWQSKHKIPDGQVEELLRWMRKAKGNKSFQQSMAILWDEYESDYDVVAIELDFAGDGVDDLEYLLIAERECGVKIQVVDLEGPGGGNPVISVVGGYDDVKIFCDKNGYADEFALLVNGEDKE